MISNGLAIGGLPPFYKPLREEFVAIGAVDASHAESFIATAANITFLMSGVFSLVGGWMVSYVRLKTLMVIGCLLLGSGLVIHSAAQAENTVYLARFLMGASLGFIGVAPNVVLIAKHFGTNRGTALGIVLTGTSIGGVVIPLLAGPLIASYGWRTALASISLLVWLALLPAVLFFIRDPKLHSEPAPQAGQADWSFRDALTKSIFWVFALCAALVFYPIFVTSQQFILYLQTPKIGLTAATAALAQSALFAVSIGGKFSAGALSDRFRSSVVMVGCAALMFASSLVLLHLTASTSMLFLLPFGLGYGGTFVLLQRMAAEFFGRHDAGKILGAITLIEVIGAAIGGRITGYLADRNGGDYTYAFLGVTVAAALAFVTTIVLITLERRHSYNHTHAHL